MYFLYVAIIYPWKNAWPLRKYAIHLFTTPFSNVIYDNMMSTFIITLTKQVSDHPFTHLYIKT